MSQATILVKVLIKYRYMVVVMYVVQAFSQRGVRVSFGHPIGDF